MVAIMSGAEENRFKTFLEENIFNEPLVYFRQFRGGQCSYSFFVKTKTDFMVIKILLNELITSDVHRYLEAHIKECPQLKGLKLDKTFVYENRMVTVQRYFGSVLPEKTTGGEIIAKIFEAYQNFAKVSAACPIKNDNFKASALYEQYRELEAEIKKSRSLKAKILGCFLRQIAPESLIYDAQKTHYVHGDFHNNQILIEDGEVSAFIDWDNMFVGYATEDYWRLFYYNLQYIYNPPALRSATERLFKQMLSQTGASKEEWLLAIHKFLLHKISGNFHKKFGLRRFIRFMYSYSIAKSAVKLL